MVYAATCSIEHMGSPILGFSGGRVDTWEPERDVYWGSETVFMDQKRYTGSEEDRKGGATAASELEAPLGAVQMGLIYVNPEGPGGNPDPQASANDIRDTFARMAMNDEETVALIAGGHTFGKGHGAADPGAHCGPSPEDAPIEAQGQGWASTHGSGSGGDTITSGLEGAWTADPISWDNGYFHNLMTYDWELTKGPGGAHQWTPTNPEAQGTVPDAHDPAVKHAPVMFTSDMALKVDAAYNAIATRFHANPDQFGEAWSKAWYKLTHRDMGPIPRCLGKWAAPEQLWQDPCPKHQGPLLAEADATTVKASIMAAQGVSPQALLRVAWGSASTFRGTDFRGGANGARIRLSPAKDWAVNDPAELATVLGALEVIKASCGKPVSMADLIVLGGCAAVEDAAKKGGIEVKVPFRPGRTDATEAETDAASYAVLEPKADGFRNFQSSVHQMVDRATLLTLTAPEMAVLVAGMRAMDANAGGSKLGVLTATPGTLNNAFFDNLIDMNTVWSKGEGCYEGKDRATGATKWKASECDLIFGSNSELRAISEHYAMDDAGEDFVADFVQAWAKVMHLDRFD